MTSLAVLGLSVTGLSVTGIALSAQAQVEWGNSLSPNEARSARARGDIVQLRDVLRQLEAQHGGYHIDANLYQKDGQQVYVIDWMTERGERLRFTVDAKSGRVLSTE